MFGLFKRTKLNSWEIKLLITIFEQLGQEYFLYKEQMESSLIKSVAEGRGDIKNYVAFLYNSNVLKKYERSTERNFLIKGIRVFDKKIKTLIDFNIYFSFGVINGYATPQSKKPNLDFNLLDVSNSTIEYIDNLGMKLVEKMLTESEIRLINLSDVYELELDNKVFFHIKDLGNGNCIIIDEDKSIYKVIHDPYQIILLNSTLEVVLR